MKIFNYLNLVGKEITTKEMELVRGGTSDSGGTCRANGCGANEKVMANKLMANFRSVNKDLILWLEFLISYWQLPRNAILLVDIAVMEVYMSKTLLLQSGKLIWMFVNI